MRFRGWMVWAAISFSVSTQAPGAMNAWTAIGPAGGTVNKIVFNKSTPSVVYAIASGGYYRSQDGGVSWQLIKSDFLNAPRDLAIDPSDANRVYVVAVNYPCLYMSTDGGATLSAVATVPTAVTASTQIAVSHSGTTLYLNSGNRIFYSADRGGTWQERTPVTSFAASILIKLAIDPTDPNTVYAAATISSTDAGIFATHDGAMTWQLLASGDEYHHLPTDFAINAANSNQIWSTRYDGIWFSSNKGVNWTQVDGRPFEAIAIDPANPAILYAGEPSGQIVGTSDSGATWPDVAGSNTAGQITTLAVDPSQSTHLLAGGLGGLSGTTTSGTQWSTQTAGLIATSILGLSADASADRIYINVSSGGIYYAAAGAASTVAVNNSTSGGLAQLSPSLFATGLLAQPGRLSVSLSSGLARSVDGGSTWSLVPVTPPLISQQVFSFASSAMNPQTILGATGSSVYRSTDGGDLWTQAIAGLPAGAVINKLAAAASDPTIFYASVYTMPVSAGPNTYLGVYKSSDAGLSWAPANAGIGGVGISGLTVDPTNANIVYATSDAALKKSVDGGVTWSPMTWDTAVSTDFPWSIAVDPKHPNILYAGGTRVARSVDGGASWQSLRTSDLLPLWSVPDLLVDPNRPENVLVATNGSGVQQFTVAPDLSLSIAAPPSPVAVGVAANFTYTVSNQGPFDATGVHFRAQLPATAQNVSATAGAGSCTVAAGVADCVFDIVRVGAVNTITLSATAPAVGPFNLAASVNADQPDPVGGNNAITTAESVANVADLSVTVTGNSTAQIGDSVSYTVVVANAGPNVATAAILKIQLAQGLTPGPATGAGATCASDASGLVTCMLGDLVATKTVTVTIGATASAAGAHKSSATISSMSADLVPANNSAASTTAVAAAPTPVASPAPAKGGGGSLSINYLLLLTLILIMQWRAQWPLR